MIICGTVEEIRRESRRAKSEGASVALVPTMGYLHEGHVSLVRKAKEMAGFTVVSLFVNPTQFGPNEDFEKYPRDFDRDRGICREAGVDALFCPSREELYPEGCSTYVEVQGGMALVLCGAKRPGHFRGVATVVSKLFIATEPNIAVFGQKDAQQAAIIRKMTRELNFPVKIVVSPIVREPDGLAMSSRNKYLSDGERSAAPLLKRGLDVAAEAYSAGERSAGKLIGLVSAVLGRSDLLRIDYVELVDGETLVPVGMLSEKPSLLAVAAFCGRTRLIDNIVLGAEG